MDSNFNLKIVVYHANVSVDWENSAICSCFIEFWSHQFLNSKDNSIFASQGHSSTALKTNNLILMYVKLHIV